MTEQAKYRIPKTGESWRHYEGGLCTIVGLARDPDGFVNVVYTGYRWQCAQLPPLYVQQLDRFLQEVENNRPRYSFERDVGDDDVCPFIRP